MIYLYVCCYDGPLPNACIFLCDFIYYNNNQSDEASAGVLFGAFRTGAIRGANRELRRRPWPTRCGVRTAVSESRPCPRRRRTTATATRRGCSRVRGPPPSRSPLLAPTASHSVPSADLKSGWKPDEYTSDPNVTSDDSDESPGRSTKVKRKHKKSTRNTDRTLDLDTSATSGSS